MEQSRGPTAVEDSDFSEEAYEQSKPLRKGKVDTYSTPSSENIGRRVYNQPKQKDVPNIDTDSFYSYEGLNGLLKVLGCVKIQGLYSFFLYLLVDQPLDVQSIDENLGGLGLCSS